MATSLYRGPANSKKIVEDSDFFELVAVVKNGVSWESAQSMHPLERRAFLYAVAQMNGGEVNWSTGEVNSKK